MNEQEKNYCASKVSKTCEIGLLLPYTVLPFKHDWLPIDIEEAKKLKYLKDRSLVGLFQISFPFP